MVELVIRLVFSLAVVLGMLILLTRFSAKKFRGGSDALVRVVHRQPLSRTSAVAVVTVGSRVLVVGTTEHQVQLLTELDPEELELPVDGPLDEPLLVPAPDPGFEAGFDAGFEVGCEVAAEPAMVEFTSLDELLRSADDETDDSADDSTDDAVDAGLELVDATYAPRHAAPGSAVEAPARPAMPTRPRPYAADPRTTGNGPLAGSLLSAQTWKQAFAAATSRNRDAS